MPIELKKLRVEAIMLAAPDHEWPQARAKRTLKEVLADFGYND